MTHTDRRARRTRELLQRALVELLANYLAGTQIALIHWWLEQEQPRSPEALAQTVHRLQRAMIRDVFRL